LDHGDATSHTMSAVPHRRAIDVLTRFARLASDATDMEEVMSLLASALVDEVPAAASAVIAIGAEGQARLAASQGCPEAVRALPLDPDAIGDELGQAILNACGAPFLHQQTRPLVAQGGLFGAVVMLF